jgi:hypothetical protein
MRPALVGAAVAALALTVAGCSQALPLGPTPASRPTPASAPVPVSHVEPGPVPAPTRLASAIVMQPGVSDPSASVTKCPAGTVALTGPGAVRAAAGDGTSPVTSPSTPGGVCFRLLGTSVTFTSAGVLVYEQPATSQPVQQPASWVVGVYLPAGEAAELGAVTTKLAGTQDQLAIIIDGRTWGMPLTLHPLTSGEFSISAQSQSQALEIQRLLQ